jgi:hypothetical protein
LRCLRDQTHDASSSNRAEGFAMPGSSTRR